ncbi:MAG: hypothetical protein RQ722_03995 [Desulfuromonadales bacterium]|nr:hypothetical protein [Desulfuromonadales bacterium]
MKKHLRKIVFWGSVLSVYALLVTAAYLLLHQLNDNRLSQTFKKISALAGDHEIVGSFLNDSEPSSDFTRILLPLGPDENRIPGSPVIWKEFLRERPATSRRVVADGFDGVQVVANVADLAKGAVAELFLSGSFSQAFRRGRFLLVLNSRGTVQIIDCVNPREPEISGSLPYHQVKQMEMQGDIAFLHLSRPGVQHESLVTIDLENPLKPRELSRFRLPEQTMSFFFLNRQLVVYANYRGYEGGHHVVHLYDVADDYRFLPLGSAKTPPLGDDLLKFGDYLLVADLRAGIDIVDFNDPLQPVIVASLALPDQIKRFFRYGNVVFALGIKNHVYAIDLHEPLSPVLVKVIEDANYSADFMEFGCCFYFFTKNGYLRVFDAQPLTASDTDDQWPTGIAGELVASQAGGGFALLTDKQRPTTAIVSEILTLPDKIEVIDKLFWQGFLVSLGDDGLVRFFHSGKDAVMTVKGSLQLPIGQRWLAASDDRLYVGGEASISVVARGAGDHFVLSGEIEFSGAESWDGLVVQRVLCVAAGEQGVVSFSLENPDHPEAGPVWKIPGHLQSQADVRQLVSPGGDRILVAAGSAGLLSGRIDDAGQFQLEGFFDLSVPLHTMALTGDFCLVSTGTDVCIIDVKSRESLQNLGKIAFSQVEKITVAAPDLWAGYVPGAGWSVLPAPRLLAPGEIELRHAARSTMQTKLLLGRYRLNLFNEHEVISVPGIVTLPALFYRPAGAIHGIN